jgi:hypothetical protein
MTKIAARFWRKIWDRDTEGPSGLEEYIAQYGKTLTAPPPPPTLANVIYQIKHSKDTSPGPNGIPFVAYRALLEAGGTTDPGPVMYRALQELCSDNPPPSAFNRANLSLFPKNHSDYVGNSRPSRLTTLTTAF